MGTIRRNEAPAKGPAARPAAHGASGAAGFTLVELIVVLLLTTVVLGATYQVLITNQRVYTVQREQTFDHRTVRSGLEVLSGELREISPSGGDILDFGPTSVEVRTMRSLGFICLVDQAAIPPRFTLRSAGGTWQVDQQVLIFADNNPARTGDDVWLNGTIGQVATGQQCPDGTGDRTRIAVLGLGFLLQSNLVHPGAPVRTYETHRYGLMEFNGLPFLGRETAGDWSPLVGPLAREGGLLLEYFDEDGAPTNQPNQVRRIDLTLRTVSEVSDLRGENVSQVMTTSVYTRN